MKKYLLLGAAALFMGGSADAWAQTGFETKSRDTTLGQARYDYGLEPQQQAAVRQDEPGLEILSVEPAAGGGRTEPFQGFTGPYFGADIGFPMSKFDTNLGDVALDGWMADVFVGYGYAMGGRNMIGGYGALELAYELSDADGDLGVNSFEKKSAIKALLKPGLMARGDAVGYGIIGYSRAEYEVNGIDENLDGLVLGAGSEFNTGLPLRMRIEYEYTN